MESFFVDILFQDPGIYTLWGDKPMTHIPVWYFTDEQMTAYYESLSEEEKKDVIVSIRSYDLPENWEKWEKIRSRFPIHKYLLFIKHSPEVPGEPKYASIYFINILESALVVQEHYDLFKKKLGHDFDPLDMILLAENDDSEFWKTVNDDSLLFGLLCGFGERNSSCFHWKYGDQSDRSKDFTQTLKSHSSNGNYVLDLKLSNFTVPAFASFSEKGEDPVIKKYEDERKNIQKIYKGKNFLDLTLQRLTSK